MSILMPIVMTCRNGTTRNLERAAFSRAVVTSWHRTRRAHHDVASPPGSSSRRRSGGVEMKCTAQA